MLTFFLVLQLLLTPAPINTHPISTGWHTVRSNRKGAISDDWQRPDALLDKIEQSFSTFYSKRPQRVLHVLAGGTLLFCSQELSYSVLFAQSFHIVGWPVLEQGYTQLRQSYMQARGIFKAELPSLMKARSLIPHLIEEKRDADMLLSKAAAFVRDAQKDVKKANLLLQSTTVAIERELPSRKKLEELAAIHTKGLPSRTEIDWALNAAKRAKTVADRKLALAENQPQHSSHNKVLIKTIKKEKMEAAAALSSAEVRRDKYDAAILKETQKAIRSLPNARKLQDAQNSARRAKEHIEKRLRKGLTLQQAALKECSDVRTLLDDVQNISNSFQAVVAAVDPQKFGEVVRGTVAGITSCVASSISPTARSALVGFDVGALIAAEAIPVAETMHEFLVARFSSNPLWNLYMMNSFKFVEQGVQAASLAAGVLIMHRAREITLLCSGALIGSKLVVSALAEQMEAILERTTIDEAIGSAVGRLMLSLDKLDGKEDGAVAGIKLPPGPKATTELLLAIAGISMQLGMQGSGLPASGFLRAPFAPLLACEAYLQKLAASASAR